MSFIIWSILFINNLMTGATRSNWRFVQHKGRWHWKVFFVNFLKHARWLPNPHIHHTNWRWTITSLLNTVVKTVSAWVVNIFNLCDKVWNWSTKLVILMTKHSYTTLFQPLTKILESLFQVLLPSMMVTAIWINSLFAIILWTVI